MLKGDAKRQYQKQWIARRRAQWIEENGPCAVCGSNQDLEVDHIDPSSKVLNPSRLWSMSPDNPIRIAELAKCQVLCGVCHKAKTKKQVENPEHGITKYRRGCRCDVCRVAGTIDRRKYARGN